MTDNFEEFENHETEHQEPLAPPPSGFRANLSGAWRSQPLFKLFVLMVVVGAIVAVAISFFSGNSTKSSVGLLKPPDMHEPPGGKSSPYLKEQTEMANAQRTQEAIQSGGSALPTPIGPGTDTGELSPGAQKEDPLNELRAEVENMNKQLQETRQAQQIAPAQQAAPEPFDDTLAQAMQRQMGQMLESWVPHGNKQVAVSDLEQINREKQAMLEKDKVMAATAGAPSAPVYATIVPAGTVSYAQLMTEANSDVPGPILGQLVSGPLKGARIVGSFQVTNNYSDYLVLTFKLADVKGHDYQINAIALDPDTTLGGMATEVDQRYLTRLILPAAAGFLQGFAQALGQGSSNIVTNGTTTIVQQSGQGFRQGEYSGLSAAAQTAGQFFENQANQTRPLVRVAAGTPMGIFFVEPVTDQPVNAQEVHAANVNALSNMNALPNGYGMSNTGYMNANGAYGNNGYPVLYPNANLPNQSMQRSAYGLMGTSNSYYPGSTVYYTH